VDAIGAEGCRDGTGHIVFTLGGSLVNALMRSAPVVMVLVPGQDSSQMLLALDQYPVQESPAQGGTRSAAG
jgi:hypothetical protein